MRFFYLLLSLISVNFIIAQELDSIKTSKKLITDINLYKKYTLKRDTIVVDTTLSIHDEYTYNYLRRDHFGLLPFANEGYLYTQLIYSKSKQYALPQFGYNAKHVSYMFSDEMLYYHVPTPLTDLYFKTVMRQGQSSDAFLTINTQPNLNFSVGFKGIRSTGDYFNNLTSNGHFRFTSSYYSPNKRYYLNLHFTAQDIYNQENGGLTANSEFESNDPSFKQRERINVHFNDASSKLKGTRYFINHYYFINKNKKIGVQHQLNYEYKFYEFLQITKSDRLGESISANLDSKVRNRYVNNEISLFYKFNNKLQYSLLVEDIYNSQFYNAYNEYAYSLAIPNEYNLNFQQVGSKFEYFKDNLISSLIFKKSISKIDNQIIELTSKYNYNKLHQFNVNIIHQTKLPDNHYAFMQSSYKEYNWLNNLKYEKNTHIKFEYLSKWVELKANYSILNNHTYFYNTTNKIDSLIVKTFQYNKSISYLNLEIGKEVKWKKLALDNRVAYQNVNQKDQILNVPQWVSRNTLYYTNHVFKKAMLLQTGVTCNYFTKYYADDYNALLGDFYVQNNTKIGTFPLIDFFVNARVRQARLYLKAEHINQLFSSESNYYNAPNYPYRDFKIRFGIEWNFFK